VNTKIIIYQITERKWKLKEKTIFISYTMSLDDNSVYIYILIIIINILFNIVYSVMVPKRPQPIRNMDISEQIKNMTKIYESFTQFIIIIINFKSLNITQLCL